MQNTEKSTALLKQQEQTLREAVHYAVDMAQKARRSDCRSGGHKGQWIVRFYPFTRD